jgi:uncharacterized protein YqjF (DUF2071 family)
MRPTESLVDFLTTPPRQSRSLASVGHRPWPLPEDRWVMAQTWQDLLFAHWRLSVSVVRANVPGELPLDEFDGSAWVGVTPFRLTGLRARWTYPLPVLSSFPELNVRTYVTVGGKPGIYFFSLDAGSALAVAAARRFYRLPYYWSEMSAKSEGREVDYRSRRRGEKRRRFAARYGPDGPEFRAQPGTLEHFLTERYCLYTVDAGVVLRADIHHLPWPLQPAVAVLRENTMAPPGIGLKGPPLLHFAARQDVVIWAPARA